MWPYLIPLGISSIPLYILIIEGIVLKQCRETAYWVISFFASGIFCIYLVKQFGIYGTIMPAVLLGLGLGYKRLRGSS